MISRVGRETGVEENNSRGDTYALFHVSPLDQFEKTPGRRPCRGGGDLLKKRKRESSGEAEFVLTRNQKKSDIRNTYTKGKKKVKGTGENQKHSVICWPTVRGESFAGRCGKRRDEAGAGSDAEGK